MSVQISVSDDVKKVLDQTAKDRSVSIGEAAEFLIGVAVSRLNALRRYAKAKAGEPVAKKATAKRATKAAPVKAKASKKAAKAA
jgi:hypothetical protein